MTSFLLRALAFESLKATVAGFDTDALTMLTVSVLAGVGCGVGLALTVRVTEDFLFDPQHQA